MRAAFRRFAQFVSTHAGSPWAFLGALALIVAWLACGPAFGFSDHWQLIVNTGTTVVTFLMVFLIQNAQNRDAKALHLKLDELIRGVQGARTFMVSLEQCTDEELDRLAAEFDRLRARERRLQDPVESPSPGDAERRNGCGAVERRRP